ncbi:unnamed protein product [Rotaria socialis]|uniref:Fringe-like glycosyltransferase domain-containing protein n=1 Tax=Rotaria socialis TaxID=392032 RepID=A0A820ZYW5_9BILA|nr:unnamed protein product [Rotaria socialis]CAF4572381.1 unnamed protein product [Rotaria socialis]
MYYHFSISLTKSHSEIESSSTRIMYVVRTSSKFYRSRLQHVLQTWISLVSQHTYFVTDKLLPSVSHDHLILTHEICGQERHAMNTLCCKTAHDFKLFHRHLTNYDWFCHFDDDQYVNSRRLEEYLSTLDSNRPYYIGRNSWAKTLDRRKQPFPYSFWFATLGAGVCLSKPLVHLLQPYTQNIAQFVDGCLKENYHDDIYLGFLIFGYLNITLTKNYRFHSHLEKDFYNDKQKFLEIFNEQITFGFRLPNYCPVFLPNLYDSRSDRYRLRSMHCLLNPHIDECQMRMHKLVLNVIKSFR